VKLDQGQLRVGKDVHLKVNAATRGPTRLNHTATHLLHAALRQVLGDHVKQAGSLVAPDRLRFDFSHFKPMTVEEITAVENLVNDKILDDLEVEKTVMSYDDAMNSGAMALFGEKYGDKVRVLKISDFSTELCGGTHVDRTGEIGSFKILGESSVAAGVRRIEAVTGMGTMAYLRRLESKLHQIAERLKVTPDEVVERVERQVEQLKKQEKELSQAKTQLASGAAAGRGGDAMDEVREVGGVKVLALRRDLDDMKALRELSDQLISKLGSGLSVLGSATGDKATLIVRVSKDLTSRFHAGDIVKELAPLVGGSGGGRPDMAQAGGSDVAGLKNALSKVYELIQSKTS
jgi:alanyl-tRNA synthetase